MTRFVAIRAAIAVTLTLLVSAISVNALPHTATHKVTDKIHRIECIDFGTANVTVYEGEKGLLVVDAGYFGTREKLAEAIAGIGNGKVITLIMTHAHNDHVGGSGAIAGGATVVAQENAANRLDVDFGYMGDESPVSMPTLTLTDTMTIDFEGEKIVLTHYPRSHTDGDIIVHFVNSKVICLGDIAFSEKLPFVHTSRGGTFAGYLKALTSALETYGDEITFIPGHGRTMDRESLRDWYNATVQMVQVVSKGVDDGMDAQQMIEADLLKDWDTLSDPVYTTKELLIRLIHQDKIYAGNPPKPISDVVRPVILEQGVEAGLKLYHELKESDPDRYDFNVAELNNLGYQLMGRGLLDEAIVVFKLNIELFPDNANVYDSMGEAYMNHGDTKLAIENYEKSLELNPGNENAEAMLKKLRGEG